MFETLGPINDPLISGHAIAGRIDALGEGVAGWAVDPRVGVGWFGGARHRCEPCRRGDMIDCRDRVRMVLSLKA